MGAKTALLAFADGDIRPALRAARRPARTETEALVRQIHPGYAIEPADDGVLWECVYPPDDVTYATALTGAELFCDRRFALGRPSELPERLRVAGANRRILMHGMHSGVDWLSFARTLCGRCSASSSRTDPIRTTSMRPRFTCTVSG